MAARQAIWKMGALLVPHRYGNFGVRATLNFSAEISIANVISRGNHAGIEAQLTCSAVNRNRSER